MIEERFNRSVFGGVPEPYYKDTESDIEYRRLFAGMAWPSNLPGYAVVVGETREVDESLNKHRLLVLNEYESYNPTDLVRRCKEFEGGLYRVQRTFGNPSSPMMSFINNGSIKLYLDTAPFCEDADHYIYYLNLIRELSSEIQQILLFLQTSKLPGIMDQVGSTDQKSEHPALLSLGYALAAFQTHSYYNPYLERISIQPDPEAAY